MTIARRLLVSMIAAVLAVGVVRTTAATALVETNPSAAARAWASDPGVELALGMTAIGAAAHRGQPVAPAIFRAIDAAAAKAPLAAEPFLVRGVQAQLAGDARTAQRAFEAAEWRDPRSLPARYFLADHYLRSSDARRGLAEFAILARLEPNGILNVTPYVASYARDPARWPQLKTLFRSDQGLEETSLEALATDPANSAAILALADPAHRNAGSPWLATLAAALVAHGEYAKARAIWADVAGVHDRLGELLFDAGFANNAPPPPFNWSLTSSTVGLAERQAGGRLHVIYYGQEDGLLASQLLILPPGQYRLAMRVSAGGLQARSLRWSLTCAGGEAPFASVGVDSLAARPWVFAVPADCGAQRLGLVGSSSDIPRQVEVTISHLILDRASANG